MKLASIETIRQIRPHQNADRLELAHVLGWQSVIKKGEFQSGERVVFVAIDTILPPAPWSQFLASQSRPDQPIRLKTVKLRGEYSQGLILPLHILPPSAQLLPEGSDVSEIIGIRKYEKEIPLNMSGEITGGFPTRLCATTDEENVLSNPELFQSLYGENVTITQKLDGSSCTIIVENGVITQVCSRRYSLKASETNSFWKAARKLQLSQLDNLVIQGELMGPKIQGNQLRLSNHEIFVFQILQDNRFLPFAQMRQTCVEALQCRHVPLIGECPLQGSLDQLQELADQQILPDKEPAEGIVVRAADYRSTGERRPYGFKVINRNFRD
jgi:RNA ligase (TIGR02306 family)